MTEIISYFTATFEFFRTLYGMSIVLTLFIMYGIYLLFINKEKFTLSLAARLLTYPFMVTYGMIMCFAASLAEEEKAQCIGLLIMLIPIIISCIISLTRRIRQCISAKAVSCRSRKG